MWGLCAFGVLVIHWLSIGYPLVIHWFLGCLGSPRLLDHRLVLNLAICVHVCLCRRQHRWLKIATPKIATQFTLQLRIHSLIQVERFRNHIRRFPKMRVPPNPKFDHPSIKTPSPFKNPPYYVGVPPAWGRPSVTNDSTSARNSKISSFGKSSRCLWEPG